MGLLSEGQSACDPAVPRGIALKTVREKGLFTALRLARKRTR